MTAIARLDPAPPDWVGPATIEGELVRLEPLGPGHLEGLAAVAFEPAIWRWMPVALRTMQDLQAWLENALRNAAAGTEVPFATLDRQTSRVIGSTRYLAIAPQHRRLEIGWTWLGVEHQGTGANREAKRLLLAHAFEVLGANRVELKTDSNNERSRAALLGIGASFEGVFRNHMIVPGGVRHSAWYSVIAEDWPAIRSRLERPQDR